jgi:5-methyltetrahydrofolate--homocysteine methyltransferase
MTALVSFTFDPQANGAYATMMGVRPETFAETMAAAGADIVGANCGTGSDHMMHVITRLRAATNLPIIAMPNAGMPVIENGETVFRETPEQMARLAPQLVEAGAGIVGGCCGTTPAHIAAIRAALM